MLTQPTIEKLCAMRLRGMAEAFEQQQQDANIHSLSFEEQLGLLIDRQWNWRQNRALERRLRNGRLQGPACIEDIDYRTPRGLDRQLVRSLTAESAWVREHQHLFLLGPTGIGKTWLARAFAQKACRDGYTALFQKAAELFRDLAWRAPTAVMASCWTISPNRSADRRRLGHGAVDRSGAPRLPGDLRWALSDRAPRC